MRLCCRLDLCDDVAAWAYSVVLSVFYFLFFYYNMALNDFVATPIPVIEALLRYEKFEGEIDEPCCGDGAISKCLEKNGMRVNSSDLFDYGFGNTGIDLFSLSESVDNIITNPPFTTQSKVKKHLLGLVKKKMALLWYVKNIGNEIEAPTGKYLKSIYVFNSRINWVGAKLGWKFAWYVWDKEHKGGVTITYIDY